jgi:endonuclease V-like protein UPF0215 family
VVIFLVVGYGVEPYLEKITNALERNAKASEKIVAALEEANKLAKRNKEGKT